MAFIDHRGMGWGGLALLPLDDNESHYSSLGLLLYHQVARGMDTLLLLGGGGSSGSLLNLL